MTSFVPKKFTLRLTPTEAEALYTTGVNNECALKYYSKERRVWWAIISENGALPYTLCQSCYHNNIFGDKDASIKSKLEPILTDNIPCNCDGCTVADGYPIHLNEDWQVGIYSLTPSIQKMDFELSSDKKTITAFTPFAQCKYAVVVHGKTEYNPDVRMITTYHAKPDLSKITSVPTEEDASASRHMMYNSANKFVVAIENYKEEPLMFKNDDKFMNPLNNIVVTFDTYDSNSNNYSNVLQPETKRTAMEFKVNVKHISEKSTCGDGGNRAVGDDDDDVFI